MNEEKSAWSELGDVKGTKSDTEKRDTKKCNSGGRPKALGKKSAIRKAKKNSMPEWLIKYPSSRKRKEEKRKGEASLVINAMEGCGNVYFQNVIMRHA